MSHLQFPSVLQHFQTRIESVFSFGNILPLQEIPKSEALPIYRALAEIELKQIVGEIVPSPPQKESSKVLLLSENRRIRLLPNDRKKI